MAFTERCPSDWAQYRSFRKSLGLKKSIKYLIEPETRDYPLCDSEQGEFTIAEAFPQLKDCGPRLVSSQDEGIELIKGTASDKFNECTEISNVHSNTPWNHEMHLANWYEVDVDNLMEDIRGWNPETEYDKFPPFAEDVAKKAHSSGFESLDMGDVATLVGYYSSRRKTEIVISHGTINLTCDKEYTIETY